MRPFYRLLGMRHGDEAVCVIPDGNKVLAQGAGDAVRALRREAARHESKTGTLYATCLCA